MSRTGTALQSEPLFALENVTVSFDSTVALREVTVEIPARAYVGLIGPNRSGKTTLMRVLCGAVKPDRGTVSFKTQNIQTLSAQDLAKEISLVPQNCPVPHQVRVIDEVLLGRLPFLSNFATYSATDYQLARNALQAVGLSPYADKHSDQLSGGERQRTTIARAITQNTDCTLLDEPTNHLDIYFQHKVLGLLGELSPSVVAVLHDINLAARYCNWVILLKNGEVFAAGPPDKVLTKETIEQVYGVTTTTFCHQGKQQFFFSIDE